MKNLRYRWVNYLLALIIGLPILTLFIWAFTARWPWPQVLPRALSLRGLKDISRQAGDFSRIIGSSMGLSMGVACLSVLIGLATSRAYICINSRWIKNLVYGLISLPFLVPALVFSMGIHQPMIRLGLAGTLPGVLMAHLVYSLPYASYLILGAYESFGFKYEEEAMLLGASPSQAFGLVSLPLLLPVLFTSFAMAYVVSFSQYFMTLLIGGGQVRTFSIIMYPYLQTNNRTVASAYGLVFLLITLAVFFIFDRFSKKLQAKYQLSSYY